MLTPEPVSYKVSEEEAKDVLSFVMNQFEPTTTYSASKRTMKDIQAWRIDKQAINTYASGAGDSGIDLSYIDTLMYIINFEDNEGFAFVSADKRTAPVLAIIDKGSMTIDELLKTDNPGFIAFMEQAVMMQLNEIAMYDEPVATYAMSKLEQSNMIGTRSTVLRNYPPRLKTKWGQWAPYNNYCPNATIDTYPTGCVITAAAQALSFFQTVNYVSWSNNGASVSSSLNWNQIIADCEDWYWAYPNLQWAGTPYGAPNAYGYGRIGEYRTTTDQVAHLMRYLGDAFKATYGKEETGADGGDAVAYLKNKCGLSSSTGLRTYNTKDIFYNYFDNYNTLIWVRADSKKTNLGLFLVYSDGHAWLIDGGREIQYSANDVRCYMHCNFGWDGYCDGYYVGDAFDLRSGPVFTDPSKELGGQKDTRYVYENKYAVLAR